MRSKSSSHFSSIHRFTGWATCRGSRLVRSRSPTVRSTSLAAFQILLISRLQPVMRSGVSFRSLPGALPAISARRMVSAPCSATVSSGSMQVSGFDFDILSPSLSRIRPCR